MPAKAAIVDAAAIAVATKTPDFAAAAVGTATLCATVNSAVALRGDIW